MRMDKCFGMENRWRCHNSVVMTLSEGLRPHCDVKYDVRYHKMAQKSNEIMLEHQQMIKLS